MTSLHLLAAAAALLITSAADAQQRPSPFGARSAPDQGGQWGARHHRGRHHRTFFPGFILVEREVPVVIEREVVVREVAPAALPPPPPAPRKPFVVGQSYASLPGGCMKMIEGAASYYYCGGGEWYRPVGKQYRAIARP